MRIYAVQHKDSEWSIAVAATTARQARLLAWRSDWRLEFADECLEVNPYLCLRARLFTRETKLPAGVLTDELAYEIGFYKEEEDWQYEGHEQDPVPCQAGCEGCQCQQ